ncbi:hypothetical protein PTKIN_Ptkin09bG0262900 [Pterospermum kingtungense]
MDLGQILGLVKLKVSFWISAKWPHIQLLDVLCCPSAIKVHTRGSGARPQLSWSPPPEDSIKINVDGSLLGKPGHAGFGGVMRDHTGAELCCFSKYVGVEDSNIAEILAIREDVEVFLPSRVRDKKLIIESDSKTAVSWVNNPNAAPWSIRNIINYIVNLRIQVSNSVVLHIFSEANQRADFLGKQGARLGAPASSSVSV